MTNTPTATNRPRSANTSVGCVVTRLTSAAVNLAEMALLSKLVNLRLKEVRESEVNVMSQQTNASSPLFSAQNWDDLRM